MSPLKVIPHSVWVKNQQRILDANRALLNDDTALLQYPKLYSKVKKHKDNRGARKYLLKLLDLFQIALDKKGLTYNGGDKPLILSVSYRFIQESLFVKNIRTVEHNIDNLASYGLIRKLTDSEVEHLDKFVYDSIIKLRDNTGVNGNTITAYALLEWTDEVLATANSTIINTTASGKINKSMSKVTMNLLGYDNVITKTNKNSFSDSDIANLNRLYSWAYQKCYKKGRAGFFTLDEYKAQFGSDKINVGERKQAQYRVALCIKLDLVCVKATKANMTSVGTNKALNLHCHQKTVFIPSSTLKTT
jgi:hypothetical protein